MGKIITTALLIVIITNVIAQNTSPLPSGTTTVGNHLSIGNGNELWSNATSLYFNYRGNAQQTHFWNLGGSSGKSIMTLYNNGQVLVPGTAVIKGDLHVGSGNSINKLHVSSSKSGISEGLRLHDAGSGSNEGLWIQFSQANMSDMARIGAKSEDVSRGSLKFYTKDANDGGAIERMIIAPNGSVGIGATSPQGNLQIGSGTGNGMLFLGGGKGYSGIGSTRSDGGLALGCNIYSRYNSDDYKKARVSETNDNGFSGIKLSRNGEIDFFGKKGLVAFDDIANSDENVKMRITEEGNIAMGTLNSTDGTGTYKLSVKGKVRADEVKVYTGWADFVFDKDYNLPTLKEVENQINAKGHLKDIPSAKEVEENGIHLGEMNSKLLQKIEELTLYTIQQEKRLNSLENRNNKLEEENKELKSISERLSQLEKLIKE